MATLKTILSVTRDTTANWNRYPEFIPKLGEIIVYTDHYVVEDEQHNIVKVPDIKIGDGVTALIHLPFIGKEEEFGDLAYKDSVEGTYTPQGTISGTMFRGTPTYITVSGTPAGDISVNAEPSGEPNYTPVGEINKTTEIVYMAESANGGGSVTAGQAASCTMPTLSMSESNEVLTISWDAGSFTANTPTEVTLPSFTQKTVVKDASFSGEGVELSAGFTGERLSLSGVYTPEGQISGSVFTGTEAVITSR